MGPFRKLLIVGVGVIALHGLQACASDTELNPQPLPPQGEPSRAPESDDGKNGSSGDLGGGTATDPGSSGGPPASVGDAGADSGRDADAADCGAD